MHVFIPFLVWTWAGRRGTLFLVWTLVPGLGRVHFWVVLRYIIFSLYRGRVHFWLVPGLQGRAGYIIFGVFCGRLFIVCTGVHILYRGSSQPPRDETWLYIAVII